MKVIPRIILSSLFFSSSCLAAITTGKIWDTFTFTKKNNQWLYQVEPQLRIDDQSNTFDQFLLNAGFGYQVYSKGSIWLGSTYVTTALDTSGPLYEYRLWQQFLYTNQFKDLNFIWRSRLEERYLQHKSSEAYRFRNRFFAIHPFYRSLDFSSYYEVFINLNHPNWLATNTLDQHRLFIGLSQKASFILTVHCGYLYQVILTHPRQVGNVASLIWQFNFN